MRMTDVALANLRRQLSAWLTHEPSARLGDDVEALHDLRVAARRIDATLKMMGRYLPTTLVRSRPTLKKLLEVLGTVRDLDVELQNLHAFAADLPDSERTALDPLQRHLRSERAHAREQMLAALDSASTQRWMDALTRALVRSTTSRDPVKDAPAVTAAPELIRRRYRKLRKAGKRLTTTSSVDEYHFVRRQSKRLRYAIEAVAEIYGKPAEETLKALRRVQEKLGVQQDTHVARARLLALVNAPPEGLSSQTIFVMGRFVERHSESASRACKRARKGLRKIRGGSWKALRARLDELAPAASHSEQILQPDRQAPDPNAGSVEDGVGHGRIRSDVA
jgi:CHAD domain-containing protein